MLKKFAFYLFATLFIFAGQFLASSGLVTGTPPKIQQPTLSGAPALAAVSQGPGLIYFWAEWCGICRSIQSNIDAVQHDFPVITVALRSGDDQTVSRYLVDKQLNWPTVNDSDGHIGQRYGVSAVPALLFINQQGEIVFTSVGYTSEWGLRLRLWLARFT